MPRRARDIRLCSVFKVMWKRVSQHRRSTRESGSVCNIWNRWRHNDRSSMKSHSLVGRRGFTESDDAPTYLGKEGTVRARDLSDTKQGYLGKIINMWLKQKSCSRKRVFPEVNMYTDQSSPTSPCTGHSFRIEQCERSMQHSSSSPIQRI